VLGRLCQSSGVGLIKFGASMDYRVHTSCFFRHHKIGTGAAMNIDHALTDPSFFINDDPHPLWQLLRKEDPLHWTEGLIAPFWPSRARANMGWFFGHLNLSPPPRVLFSPGSRKMNPFPREGGGAEKMIPHPAPPLHGAMRRAFNRLFLPRAVGRFASPGVALVQ